MKRALALALWCVAAAACAEPQSLASLLSTAKAQNPSVRQARAQLAEMVARHAGTRAMSGPQASLTGFATSGNKPSIFDSAPGADPVNRMGIVPGTFLNGSVMVMAPIFAQELGLKVGAARWQVKMAAADLLEAEAEVQLRVTERFWAEKSQAEEIKALEAQRIAIQELLRATQARFEVGSTIEASVSRVKAELSRVERSLSTARNESAKIKLDLRALLGASMDSELELAAMADSESTRPELSEWIQLARTQRGMILAAKARVGVSDSELRAARALNQPKLFAVGMADATNRRDMSGLSVGLTLSFPLYDGGRIRAEIAEAKSLRANAESQLAAAVLDVEREVHRAFLDRETARANLVSAEASLNSAQATYEVIRLRTDAGKAILLELLDALQVLAEAQSELTRSRFELNVAEAMLRRAAGVSL